MASITGRLHHKILIVEDDPLVRMAGVDLLEEAGFEVIDAHSADEAITVLEGTTTVQLLFTDIDMPGSMNGLELAELVHQRWPNVRLLITSGNHDIPDADVPDDGHFVPKPYSSMTVVTEITNMLDGR